MKGDTPKLSPSARGSNPDPLGCEPSALTTALADRVCDNNNNNNNNVYSVGIMLYNFVVDTSVYEN